MGGRYEFLTCDVFTDHAYSGNPLAVLPDARGLDDAEMQAIAAEFNLSETAFVIPRDPPALRIFTPASELPFAGHPTIGTAHVLHEAGLLAADAAFEERVGRINLEVEPAAAGGSPRIWLTTATLPERGPTLPDPAALAHVLGLGAEDLHLSWPAEAWSCGVPFACIALRDRTALSRVVLDRTAWQDTLARQWAEKIYVFTPGTGYGELHARMFAPSIGIDEDPAPGAAASALAGYLARHASRPRDDHWTIHQGVELGRPSRLELALKQDNGALAKVRLGGRAVTVSSGWLVAPDGDE